MIKINKLDKFFNKGKQNELHVLNEISLEFEEKGMVCILGESGSGKTTLLNTIGGLDTFGSGWMQFDEEVVKKYDAGQIEKIRNQKFGYIFQNYYLLQDYTVAYNVKLALNVFEMSEKEKEERVEYVLKALGIEKYKKKLVSQLSGGQQQRVSIARALVKAPQIILADEPTGNLDEENTLRTMSILKKISKECLVIVVSHEKRIAKFFADRIIEIKDGAIEKDYQNQAQDAYTRADDANIYLKELSETVVDEEEIEFHLYKPTQETEERENEKTTKIRLNLAWKDGKIYLQNLSEYDLIFEGEESGCLMLDQKKPELQVEEADELTDYKLERPKGKKKPKLPMQEIWKMACENIRIMGKKQAFILSIMVLTGCVLAIACADFMNRISVDEESFITEDSRYIEVEAYPAPMVFDSEMEEKLMEYCEEYVYAGEYADTFTATIPELSLEYHGFGQLYDKRTPLEGYCFVEAENLKEKEVIAGSLPTGRDEVVVDVRVLKKFMQSDSVISPMYEKVEDFLGQGLKSAATDTQFTIVGICESGQPNIYVNANKIIGLTLSGYNIASLNELQQMYPSEYDEITLKADEAFVPESVYKNIYRFGSEEIQFIRMENGARYQVVGYYPDTYSAEFVLSEEECIRLRRKYITTTKTFRIFTDDIEGAMSYYQKSASDYNDFFGVLVTYPYEEQLKAYEEEQKKAEGFDMKNLITIILVVLSMVMIYFTIQSNALSRMEELTVYRLIGIAKGSILKAYILEMILITLYTSFPAILLTSIVIKTVATIPSLEFSLLFPWWSMGILLLIVFVLNIMMSILPVYRILSKPPAVLAVK